MATIAIVENDKDNRDLLQILLENQGYGVEQFTSGKDFLQSFKSGLYRLIMMDLSMPDMDGYDLLREVRRQDADVPVMAVTGRAGPTDRAQAHSAGFSDVVTKPLFDLPTFYALIIKHLNAHLTRERLFALADRTDIVFTLEEFNHVKNCTDCFRQWVAHIESRQGGS